MSAKLYIGTSSWSEPKLIESGFYPEDVTNGDERLAFYAQRFNLSEVDSTYYAFTSRKKTEAWAGLTPGDFRFNVKGFALFTQHPARLSSIPKSFHEALPDDVRKKARVYHKDIPDEVLADLWGIFRGTLRPLREAGKLGAVLIDFPPWFVPSKANREFLQHLRERLPEERVAVEFRSPLWASDDASVESTVALLRELDIGFVCVDEPPGLKTSFPPVAVATSAIGYVRFRGRNAERWEDKSASIDERLDWWYTDEQLGEWLPRIESLRAETEEVYLVFNTKMADQGVQIASRMQDLLRIPSA
jgi:uncharacterized protein YecE (DUF72 family)